MPPIDMIENNQSLDVQLSADQRSADLQNGSVGPDEYQKCVSEKDCDMSSLLPESYYTNGNSFHESSKPIFHSTTDNNQSIHPLLPVYQALANYEPNKLAMDSVVTSNFGAFASPTDPADVLLNGFRNSQFSCQQALEQNLKLSSREEETNSRDCASKTLPGIRLPPLVLPCQVTKMINRGISETSVVAETDQEANLQKTERVQVRIEVVVIFLHELIF